MALNYVGVSEAASTEEPDRDSLNSETDLVTEDEFLYSLHD